MIDKIISKMDSEILRSGRHKNVLHEGTKELPNNFISVVEAMEIVSRAVRLTQQYYINREESFNLSPERKMEITKAFSARSIMVELSDFFIHNDSLDSDKFFELCKLGNSRMVERFFQKDNSHHTKPSTELTSD